MGPERQSPPGTTRATIARAALTYIACLVALALITACPQIAPRLGRKAEKASGAMRLRIGLGKDLDLVARHYALRRVRASAQGTDLEEPDTGSPHPLVARNRRQRHLGRDHDPPETIAGDRLQPRQAFELRAQSSLFADAPAVVG